MNAVAAGVFRRLALIAVMLAGCNAGADPVFRRLPGLDLAVFGCAPSPTDQVFSSRAELDAAFEQMAVHCAAEDFQARRERLLASLEQAGLRWPEETLVVLQDWYGTGMARARLELSAPAPDTVAASIAWTVPPPPVTPDTAQARFAFVVRRPPVRRVELGGRSPRVVELP